MIRPFHIANTLRNAVSRDTVATCTVKTGCIDGAHLHHGIAYDADLDNAIPRHGNFAVIKLKIFKPAESILGKLPPGHDTIMCKHFQR